MTTRWIIIAVAMGAIGCADDDAMGSGSGSQSGTGASAEGSSVDTGGAASSGSEAGSAEGSAEGGSEGMPGECLAVSLDCAGSEPLLQANGTPSGFERCADGFVHRATATACTTPTPSSTCETPGAQDECTVAADCDAEAFGACMQHPDWQGGGCGCAYGCATDADCDPGQVCACGESIADGPRCVAADCVSDADCEGLCGLDPISGGCGLSGYLLACLDATAECRGCCPEAVGCYDNVGTPRCDVLDGAWTCNIDSLCEDCG